jgi:hypothetical protein
MATPSHGRPWPPAHRARPGPPVHRRRRSLAAWTA